MPSTALRAGPVRLLLLLIGVTAIAAVPAGLGLVVDPSGAALRLTPELMRHGPFPDYRVPGAFLFLVLGLGGVAVVVGLWTRSPWAVPTAMGYGLVLLAWVTIQALVMGILSPLQPLCGTIGLLIVAMALAAAARP